MSYPVSEVSVIFPNTSRARMTRSPPERSCVVQLTCVSDIFVQAIGKLEIVEVEDIETSSATIERLSVIVTVVSDIIVFDVFVGAVMVTTGAIVSSSTHTFETSSVAPFMKLIPDGTTRISNVSPEESIDAFMVIILPTSSTNIVEEAVASTTRAYPSAI